MTAAEATATNTARRREIPPLLVVAFVIDALGSGLTAPFTLIVGSRLVGLPLPVAGLAASIGGLVGIAGGPLAGAFVDRFGPVRTVVAANLVCAIGNVCLLLAGNAVAFALGSAICAFAVRAFFSAFAPLISSLTTPATREKWFGLARGSQHRAGRRRRPGFTGPARRRANRPTHRAARRYGVLRGGGRHGHRGRPA